MVDSQCKVVLGFDPGRDKCGVAVVHKEQLLYHQVIESSQALVTISSLCQKFKVELIVMGNQTTAKTWRTKIEQTVPNIPLLMVDERNSTLEARERYWQMYPPKGFARLIPQGMRLPPRPIDDIVAILLIERLMG